MTKIKFEYEEMISPIVKIDDIKKEQWEAGDQIFALKFYLKPDVKVLWEYIESGRSGESFALLKYKRQYVLWRASFGSCSVCDGLDGRGIIKGKNYIKLTLTEGNCHRFDNLKDVERFVIDTDTHEWSALPRDEFAKAIKV